MSENNIVIVGGGFAGTKSLRYLTGPGHPSLKDFKIVLVDRKDNFEFLPMLPDIIGGWLRPENLRVSLKKITDSHRCEFIQDEVREADFERQKLNLAKDTLSYEYLLICSGSETNFFSNESAAANCFKLDNIQDAIRIKESILAQAQESDRINIVVVGGGYTGVEIASNVNYLLEKNKIKYKIYILERTSDILKIVPDWMRKNIRQELENLNIEIICADAFKVYDGETVFLESGMKIEDAFCIWSAGVKTSAFIDKLEVNKEQTRIKINENLSLPGIIPDNVFIAGDAGSFFDNRQEKVLRMAVMFSLAQAKVAARNVISSILKKPLVEYTPLDLGYLIPIASGKAPGIVLNKRIHGFLGYLMHYIMCIYRLEWKNKFEVTRDLFLKILK